MSVACPCLSAASQRLSDVWFSKSQRVALGQWGAGYFKICGARIESPQVPIIQGMGGVGTVYPAESWAPHGRAHESSVRPSVRNVDVSQSHRSDGSVV